MTFPALQLPPKCAACVAGMCDTSQRRHARCGERSEVIEGKPRNAWPAVTTVAGTACCEDCAESLLVIILTGAGGLRETEPAGT